MKTFRLNVLACMLIAAFCAQTAFALSLNPFKREGRTRAQTLLVTGNFLEPRLLVELAQYRTKQPIILIAPDGYGHHRLFFMPSDTKPVDENEENFVELIDLINPQRVIFLGSSDFVPQRFIDAAQKKYPVLTLNNQNWEANANTLAELLNQPRLTNLFIEYRDRYRAATEAAKQAE